MNNKNELVINKGRVLGNIISSLFGILFLIIGLINIFWGNDMGYGIFIVLLALIYFPPAASMFHRVSGFSIPVWLKILVAAFSNWSAFGVGELFAKIGMMKADLFQ